MKSAINRHLDVKPRSNLIIKKVKRPRRDSIKKLDLSIKHLSQVK